MKTLVRIPCLLPLVLLLAVLPSRGQDTFVGGPGGGGSQAGASNALTRFQNQTNSQVWLAIGTNNLSEADILTAGAGANSTNTIRIPLAGSASIGLLHSGDYQRIPFHHVDHASTTNRSTNEIHFTSESYQQITNTLGAAPQHLTRVFKHGTFWIQTNNTPLYGKFRLEGATLILGSELDNVATRPYFSDIGGTARTLEITGWGTIISSNVGGSGLGSPFVITNPSSTFTIDVTEMNRPISGPGPLVYQRAGTLNLRVRKLMQNEGYDCYWGDPYGNSLKVFMDVGRMRVADTAVELSTGNGTVLHGNAYFNLPQIDTIEGGQVFSIEHSCVIDLGTLISRLSSARFFADGTDQIVVRGGYIQGDTQENADLVDLVYAAGNVRFEGTVIESRTNNAAISVYTNGLELVGAKVISAGTYGITNAAGAAREVYVEATRFTAPVDPQLTLKGGLKVREQDGSPSVEGVTTILFSNGTVTDNGAGSISVTSGGGAGGSATNAAGAAPNVQYKHADGSFAGATGINVDTNGVTNILVTGAARAYRHIATNGIHSQGWLQVDGQQTNTLAAWFGNDVNVDGNLIMLGDILGVNMTLNGQGTFSGPLGYTVATISGTEIDWGANNARYKQLTANTTFTFTGLADDRHIWVELQQDSTGTRTVTWPTVTWLGHTNQTGVVDINTNANLITVYHLWRRSGTIYGEVSLAPSRFDVEWSSGSVPSSDIATRLNNETGSGAVVFGDGATLGSFTLSSNITFTSAALDAVSQATNHTADFNFAERHFSMTNHFHVSAVANTASGDTAPKYWLAKLENLSGSDKTASVSSSFKRSGTNYVTVPNGSAVTVWLRSHGAQTSNTLATITLFNSP